MPRCRPHPASNRCAPAAHQRCPAAPADTPHRFSATAFRARLSGRIPSRVPSNASFLRSPPRTHPRSPVQGDSRADIPPRQDRPQDARKSSRPLQTATLLSIVNRLQLPALAPPQSSPPWRHSPMPKPALRFPPTTAPLLPGSPAESLPPALSNPRPSCLLLSRPVSACENHTPRPARIQRETFHALLLVPFELNRDLFFVHLKLIGRRGLERNRRKIAGVRGARCVQQCDHFQLAIHNSQPVRDTQFVAPVVALIALELFRRQRNRSLHLLMLFFRFLICFFWLHQAGQIDVRNPARAIRWPRASQIAQARH